MSEEWAFYNGKLIEAGHPAVPVQSRGLMYGDGCFDTFRTYGGMFFKLQAHLKRLKAGADFLDLKLPAHLSASSIKEMVATLLHKNGLNGENGVVRIQLWRSGSRGYTLHGSEGTQYSLQVTPLPEDRASISLATVETRRIPNKSLPARLKLCNNINYITAARQAERKGADDALMQDIEGYVSETTIGNIFWVEDDMIYTPSESCDLLPGITRGTVLELIRQEAAYKLKEGRYPVERILSAGEVWMCNSVRGLVPVAKINDREFETNSAVFASINEAYQTHLKQLLSS